MNFKIYFFFISFILISCGVKGPPRPPAGTEIPPMHHKYMHEFGATPTETPIKTNNAFDDEIEAR